MFREKRMSNRRTVAKVPRNRCVVCGSWIKGDGFLCTDCQDSVVLVTVVEHDRRPYSDGSLERMEGKIRRAQR